LSCGNPLKAARKDEWSAWVSSDWRLTFCFHANDATDVNDEADP